MQNSAYAFTPESIVTFGNDPTNTTSNPESESASAWVANSSAQLIAAAKHLGWRGKRLGAYTKPKGWKAKKKRLAVISRTSRVLNRAK